MALLEELTPGSVWAWRASKRDRFEPVRILGALNSNEVRGERIEDGDRSELTEHAAHFRCPWDRLSEYLLDYRLLDAQLQAGRRGERFMIAPPPEAEREDTIAVRQTVLSPPEPGVPRVAYSLQAAAEECGVSTQFLRAYVRRGDLVVHYAGSRMLILAEDLRAWVGQLPTDRE